MPTVLFLASCISSKQQSRAEKNHETHKYIRAEADSATTHIDAIISEETDSETQTVNYWVIYDTDKPENPETGRPPVKAEGRTEQSHKQNSRHDGHSELSHVSESHNEVMTDETKATERVTEKKNEWAPKGGNVRTVLALLVAISIIVLYVRIKKR